jgi:hypothetical protein
MHVFHSPNFIQATFWGYQLECDKLKTGGESAGAAAGTAMLRFLLQTPAD